MSTFNILALSGSLRQGSTNTRALHFVQRACPSTIYFELFLRLDRLPHFNPELEASSLVGPVESLRQALKHSDALMISCPEYAHGLPGSFKNALDWLVGVGLERRPIAIINTSPRATHAPAQLREVLRTMDGVIQEAACITLKLSQTSSEAELARAQSEVQRCLDELRS